MQRKASTAVPMSRYDISPSLVSFVVKYLHTIGGISMCLSTLVFFLIARRTHASNRDFARLIAHVQVWVVVLDVAVCLLLVPVPLFPVLGTLCYGVFCSMGGSPHIPIVCDMLTMKRN
ncbi:hypothetical protein PFISCL1PPCAC_12758, partial [Pristionchus fissidentatus]